MEVAQQQHKGYLLQPMLLDEHLPYLPAMIQNASTWLTGAGKETMVVEVSDHRTLIHDTLIHYVWEKQHTWCELVKWLDEEARQKTQG